MLRRGFAALVVAAGLVGCGDDDGGARGDNAREQPTSNLPRALQATLDTQRVEFDVDYVGDGGDLRAEGRADFADARERWRLGPAPKARGALLPVDGLVDGDQTFLRRDGESRYRAVEGGAAAGPDVAGALRLLAGAGDDVREEAREEVAGDPTVRYAATVSLAGERFPIRVWVGPRHNVYRLRYPVTGEELGLPGLEGRRYEATLDLYSFFVAKPVPPLKPSQVER